MTKRAERVQEFREPVGSAIFDVPATEYNFLSLGAGVQSSCLALMAAREAITPMPDAAIFADTQAEPQGVYDWLDWLESELPFPVVRVTAGSLTEAALSRKTTKDGRNFSKTAIPVFTLNEDGSQGMIGHRTCTRDFKIRPLMKAVRRLAAIKRGQKECTVTQWIGISWDEIQRIKESREPWVQNRWPLIERRMTRQHCKEWITENGYPQPPRSACSYCPFHSDREWKRLKAEEPAAFAEAVRVEEELQNIKAWSDTFKSEPYLHRSLVNLKDVDFRADYEKGQELLGFMNECEGMCGV